MTGVLDLSGYFAVGLDSETALSATYSPLLVVISFLIAALAGFAFIHLSHWIAEQKPSFVRTSWIVTGALIMGLGVWAMHFVGMIAYQIPVPVIYDPAITASSALPAVIASALSLQMVARSRVGYLRLVLGGVVLGGGIGMMHYTGMAAMEMEAFVRYDPALFAASILVAIILAICALWVARRRTRNPFSVITFIRELYSAILIGAAVAGMHYTAMSSTLCFATGNRAVESPGMDAALLAVLTTIVAVMILIAGIAAVIFDRRLTIAVRNQERATDQAAEADRRLNEAVEAMSGSLALFDAGERLVFSNSQFRTLYGLQQAEQDGGLFYQTVLDWHVADYESFRRNRDPGARDVVKRLRESRDRGQPITLEGRNSRWLMIRQHRTVNDGTVFLCTDVTDIRQTEALLEQQQNRLRLIMDNVADAVLTISSEGVIESFNRAAERIFGFPEEEIVGQ
ncbi:MAG: MHYT domain-containing protein, partial [Rhodospirillales bacterium]